MGHELLADIDVPSLCFSASLLGSRPEFALGLCFAMQQRLAGCIN